MVEAPHISDMLVPDVDVIGPDEPVRAAQRRMEAQTRRSLIVVEGDRPIGVVQWRDIMRVQGPESDQPVRDFMVREVPVLKTDMTLDEARAQLTGEVDLDRLPVVNEQGQLVGEVPRQAVVHQAAAVEPGAAGVTEREVVTGMRDTGDQFATTETAERAFQLQKGMDVVGSQGHKLGTVEDVMLDTMGRVTAFTVKHGLLSKKLKRLPADNIDRVEDGTVHLNIDQTEFKMLADIEA